MRKIVVFLLCILCISILISCSNSNYNYDKIININNPVSYKRYDYSLEELKKSDSSVLISIDDQLVFNDKSQFDLLAEKQFILSNPKNNLGIFNFEPYYAPVGLLVLDEVLKDDLILIIDDFKNQLDKKINQLKELNIVDIVNCSISSISKARFFIYDYEGYSNERYFDGLSVEERNIFQFSEKIINKYTYYEISIFIKYLSFFIPKCKVNVNEYISNLNKIITILHNDSYICPLYEIKECDDYYVMELKRIEEKKYNDLYYNTYSFDKNIIELSSDFKFEKIYDITPTLIDYSYETKLDKYSFYRINAIEDSTYYLVFDSSKSDSVIIDFVYGRILTNEVMNDRYSRFNYMTEKTIITNSKYIIKEFELKKNDTINMRIINLSNDATFKVLDSINYSIFVEALVWKKILIIIPLILLLLSCGSISEAKVQNNDYSNLIEIVENKNPMIIICKYPLIDEKPLGFSYLDGDIKVFYEENYSVKEENDTDFVYERIIINSKEVIGLLNKVIDGIIEMYEKTDLNHYYLANQVLHIDNSEIILSFELLEGNNKSSLDISIDSFNKTQEIVDATSNLLNVFNPIGPINSKNRIKILKNAKVGKYINVWKHISYKENYYIIGNDVKNVFTFDDDALKFNLSDIYYVNDDNIHNVSEMYNFNDAMEIKESKKSFYIENSYPCFINKTTHNGYFSYITSEKYEIDLISLSSNYFVKYNNYEDIIYNGEKKYRIVVFMDSQSVVKFNGVMNGDSIIIESLVD